LNEQGQKRCFKGPEGICKPPLRRIAEVQNWRNTNMDARANWERKLKPTGMGNPARVLQLLWARDLNTRNRCLALCVLHTGQPFRFYPKGA